MMQEAWTLGIGWDEELPPTLNNKWIQYKDEMSTMKHMMIPRWIGSTRKSSMELHGFADASESAYAAAIYCRCSDEGGHITTHLLMSKTRVAPIKIKLSIPRLELNAALLLARLMKHVQGAMHLADIKTYCWSDSTITLAWIHGDPRKFKTFVANRISTIRSSLPETTWRHVKSSENPADLSTRGTTPLTLANNKLWWNGPEFLRLETTYDNCDATIVDTTEGELQPEELKDKTISVNLAIPNDNAFNKLFQRHSSFDKIKRIVAYCHRFIQHKSHKDNYNETISSDELQSAEWAIIKLIQHQDFNREIECLRTSNTLNRKSRLLPLNPVIDVTGLLRMNGRLQNSDLPVAAQSPLILTKNNIVTLRIIEDAHRKTLHGGTQLTLAYLRDKYWIIDGKRAVSKVIQKCIKCFRHKQHKAEQLMGSLPAARVQPRRAFANTGIDYAGPIQLRTTGGRGYKAYKGYIAIFICMVTKAIHIEIVSSQTTEAFIAAYKRFVSRRGLCTNIYSDNGTNFVGADTILKKNYNNAMTTLPNDIATMLATDGTTWHFIPPHAPHFGGIWEAGVKSIKFHLKRTIGESTLTFEELYTVTAQIEACLNSRPLTPLNNNPDDQRALTPGHFLIGESLKASPCGDIEFLGLKARWQLVEQMVRSFWKRWSSEYIHQLQTRIKWQTKQPNLLINGLVLLKDEQLPATRWKLGRVIDTFIGRDGLVRVASIKCADAVYKRPIVKLCKLPVEDESVTTLLPTSAPKCESSETIPSARKIQPPRRAKNPGGKTSTVLPIFIAFCVLSVAQANIHVSPFNHSSGIYFEELGRLEITAMKWKLIIHYNLSTFWEELNNFKIAHSELETVCAELPSLNCNPIVKQLSWQYNNLISDNKLIFEGNKERRRVKRGFGDTVGLVLGDMFGVLSQREAEEYEAQFEKINNNENHLLALIKNQTTVIDNTIKLVKHNSELTTTAINNLAKEQQRMRLEVAQLQEYRTYEDRMRAVLLSILEMTLILKGLEDTQQSLIDVVYQANQKYLHSSILTPGQLEEELQQIRSHVATSVTIPGHNIHDLQHLYQSMTIRGRVTQNNIIIEVTLPLSFAWDYTLLAVIPVPDINHSSVQAQIITSTDYIAMDHQREHFALLSKEDVRRCKIFQPMQFLCEVSPIIRSTSNQSQCEIAILQRQNELDKACEVRTVKPTNHWIKLHTPNKWIYVLPNETTVDVICGDKVRGYNIQGSGVAHIDAGCVLKDSETQIIAIGTMHHNISNPGRKATNIIQGAKNIRKFTTYIENRTKDSYTNGPLTTLDTTNLENQLETLKSYEFLPTDDGIHHIHHYSMIHILFWGILIIGIIWMIRRLRRRTIDQHQSPPPLPRPGESAV